MEMETKDKDSLRYVAISLSVTALSNQLAYHLGRVIGQGRPHWNLTLPIERAIPFLPATISIYFGCFFFWAAAYLLMFCQEERESDRFFCANLLANCACFFCFILFPTTNVRPAFSVVTIWDEMTQFLYRVDAPDNLFPSVHCMVSWFCWIGVRGRKDYSPVWRAFSLIMAIAVCVSTLTTRQHVLLDVAGGILLSEFAYWLAGHRRVRLWYDHMIGRCMRISGSER